MISWGYDTTCVYAEKTDFPKWWHASERSKFALPNESGKAGKPNVSYRKVIYSQNEDGSPNERHMVNAQNYAVLVTDVPDIQKGKTR